MLLFGFFRNINNWIIPIPRRLCSYDMKDTMPMTITLYLPVLCPYMYLRVCHSGFAEKSSNQIAGKIKPYKTEELFTKLNS